MPDHGTAPFDVGHPAPDRGRVSPATLIFALGAAPLAWSLQLTATASLAGAACVAGDGPGSATPAQDWTRPTLIVINVVAIGVALLALYVARLAFASTPGDSEGTHEAGGIMDAGEGRTRFLAIWGIWTSILFLCAIAFNTVAVWWAGLCVSG